MNCPHCASGDWEHRASSEALDRDVFKCNDCGERFKADSEGVRK